MHPKTFDLAGRLDAPLPLVIGYLELLWHFTTQHAPQGDIGKWSDQAIARACQAEMPDGMTPDLFVQAFVDAGFIDVCSFRRLVIHDWHEHAPAWVAAKLKREKRNYFIANTETYDLQFPQSPLSDDSEATSNLTQPNHTQPKKDGSKRRKSELIEIDTFIAQCKATNTVAIPPDDPVFEYAREAGVPVDFIRLAWREFVTRYRAAKKKQKGINGWRQAFRNCIRGNWYKLWWFNADGGCELTTTGVQAKRVHREVSNG